MNDVVENSQQQQRECVARFEVVDLIFMILNLFLFIVESVSCEAAGMRLMLKEKLPQPRGGMWDLEVENFPKCPGATKTDVGGGYEFTILYADKEWCGVDAEYKLVLYCTVLLHLLRIATVMKYAIQTPAWLAFAKVVLLLKDDNGTVIADSVSCVYDTRFETSLMTFRGEIRRSFHRQLNLANQGQAMYEEQCMKVVWGVLVRICSTGGVWRRRDRTWKRRCKVVKQWPWTSTTKWDAHSNRDKSN